MPRKPRIHYLGAIYHVILRGNSKQNIFFDNYDRQHFCLLLQQNVERYHCRIHAFCLMNNHIHLLIQVRDIPLTDFMHNTSFKYANWINKRYERVGHVFQGRYKAILVDDEPYLKTLIRYIHLNPCEAGLSQSPDDYWWSSHHNYLGKLAHAWVTTDFILSLFSNTKENAILAYSKFINSNAVPGTKIW